MLVAAAMAMVTSCDKGGEEATSYTTLDSMDAYYYADYYQTGVANWSIGLFSEVEGEYLGVELDINMATQYDFAGGRLQEGTYTVSDSGDALTVYTGRVESYEGEDYPVGSYYYDEVSGTYFLATGGTIEIKATGDGGYLVTTDLTAVDVMGEKVDNLRYKFEGMPELVDESLARGNVVKTSFAPGHKPAGKKRAGSR